VARLIAKSALDGLLPLAVGQFCLSEATPDFITSIAPFKGQGDAASKALRAACGVAFPAPGCSCEGDDIRAIWTGQGQAFLLAGVPVEPSLSRLAALSDQTDGWVVLRLVGAGARDVLARRTSVDLRPSVFGVGHVARAPLGGMMSVLVRIAAGFEIMVFRSMAGTAVREIGAAMRGVAAERRLQGEE